MNPRQHVFWEQARSDWQMYEFLHSYSGIGWHSRLLRRMAALARGRRTFPPIPVCHELHYLQMCTEKLAKAYFTAPPTGHAAFRKLRLDLSTNPRAVKPLGFSNVAELTRWLATREVENVVNALEDLAPQFADQKKLPNPEYPWPRGLEIQAPASYPFRTEVLDVLNAQVQNEQQPFLDVLARMVPTLDQWCQ